MKKILSEGNLLIAKRGASLIVVFAMLIVSIVAVASNFSFGWFAKNNSVTANGMTTQAYHAQFRVYYATVTLDENGAEVIGEFTEIPAGEIPVLEELKAPGDTVDFQIKIVNVGLRAVNLMGFGLEAPTVDEEKPKVDAEGSHYLSTELHTRLVSVSASATVNDDVANIYLRTDSGAGRVDYFDHIEGDAISLAVNEEVVFGISMTFENKEESQNVFKNFDDEGKCARRLFFTYEEP